MSGMQFSGVDWDTVHKQQTDSQTYTHKHKYMRQRHSTHTHKHTHNVPTLYRSDTKVLRFRWLLWHVVCVCILPTNQIILAPFEQLAYYSPLRYASSTCATLFSDGPHCALWTATKNHHRACANLSRSELCWGYKLSVIQISEAAERRHWPDWQRACACTRNYAVAYNIFPAPETRVVVLVVLMAKNHLQLTEQQKIYRRNNLTQNVRFHAHK